MHKSYQLEIKAYSEKSFTVTLIFLWHKAFHWTVDYQEIKILVLLLLALLEHGNAAEDSGSGPDANLQELHGPEDAVLEVGVGAGSGIAPMEAPPDGQEEEVDGVNRHAIVVSNWNAIYYFLKYLAQAFAPNCIGEIPCFSTR